MYLKGYRDMYEFDDKAQNPEFSTHQLRITNIIYGPLSNDEIVSEKDNKSVHVIFGPIYSIVKQISMANNLR